MKIIKDQAIGDSHFNDSLVNHAENISNECKIYDLINETNSIEE